MAIWRGSVSPSRSTRTGAFMLFGGDVSLKGGVFRALRDRTYWELLLPLVAILQSHKEVLPVNMDSKVSVQKNSITNHSPNLQRPSP